MGSVADKVRASDRQRALRLSPAARVAEALALGERDLQAYQIARGLDRATALRDLRRKRHLGRPRSVAGIERGA